MKHRRGRKVRRSMAIQKSGGMVCRSALGHHARSDGGPSSLSYPCEIRIASSRMAIIFNRSGVGVVGTGNELVPGEERSERCRDDPLSARKRASRFEFACDEFISRLFLDCERLEGKGELLLSMVCLSRGR
jgi:hypothetical protein